MKNQWPFWLFIIAILVVVFIALNYQGKDEVASLGEIFPEEHRVYDYEYVPSAPEQKATAETVTRVSQDPAVVEVKRPVTSASSSAAPAAAPSQTEAVPKKVEATSTASSQRLFTVQVLSSKDLKATQDALQQVKANGFSDAYVKSVELGDKGTWHRIYIGSYPNKVAADQGLARVKEKYPQAFLTMSP